MNSRISGKAFQDQAPLESTPEDCDGKVSGTVWAADMAEAEGTV